jgi:hypothetical protein
MLRAVGEQQLICPDAPENQHRGSAEKYTALPDKTNTKAVSKGIRRRLIEPTPRQCRKAYGGA